MITVLNKKNYDFTAQPMFLGEPLGIQRYDRFKYPKFYELYLQQEEQRWTPFEISLSKDRASYEALSAEERFVFESNLRWQTMTDSMLSRSIHEMAKYISLSELEICVGSWSNFENIHSLSYTWILQNITKNPSAFFDSILEDKHIVERAAEISAAYDKLLIAKETDLKQQIFNAVLSTQITEGLAFYISFACAYYFGYRGKMVGNASIVRLIGKDEALHVAITQNIMKYWRENPEEGFQDVFEGSKQMIYDAYGLAVESEKKWAQYLFSNGSLMGLNANLLGGYIEWLANTRLQSLGMKKIFDIKTNPIGGWLDAYLDDSKAQPAPQEMEITNYFVGSRDTTIDEDAFKDYKL